MINTVLVAGYPKSGNTLLGSTFSLAGNICDSGYDVKSLFDIYTIRRKQMSDAEYHPRANPFFPGSQVHIKTHESFRRWDLDNIYFGDTNKVIVISRNPFDTFLSSLNFLRAIVKLSGAITQPVSETLRKLSPASTFPDNPNQFVSDFTLENLKHENLLDDMFVEYANIGTAFSAFMDMSSPWALFSYSYNFCEKPVCRIKFEDLSSGYLDDYKKISDKIGGFLECDPFVLEKSFQLQRNSALERQKEGSIFFSKVASEYYLHYLSKSSLKYFCSLYQATMIDLEYTEILDSLCK